MTDEKSPRRGLTRRSFLKSTAAAAGAVAVAGAAAPTLTALAEEGSPSSAEEQVFAGTCRGASCNSGCSLNVHVRDGKVVYVTPCNPSGDEQDPRFEGRACLKGMSHVNRIYNPERTKYPLRRVGERGGGEWERISWEEAVTEITDKWKEIRAKYGNEALIWVGSNGNAGFLGTGSAAFLPNAMGMVGIEMGYDMAINGWSPKFLGFGALYSSNAIYDCVDSKAFICWGANITNSYMQNWRFVCDAREKGAKLIVIDTCYTPAAAKADKYVFVRPGTDAALALGMMGVLLEDDLVDIAFMKRGTVAPFFVKRSDRRYYRLSDAVADEAAGQPILIGGELPSAVLAKVQAASANLEDSAAASTSAVASDPFIVWDLATDGYALHTDAEDPDIEGVRTLGTQECDTAYQLLLDRIAEYPLEKASEISDVSVEDIRELSHLIAENSPAFFLMGFGIDHYANGHYNVGAITAFAMMTGNVGRHGAACGVQFPLGPYANSKAPMLDGTMPYQVPMLQMPQWVETGEYKGKPFNMKAIYSQCGNWIENNAGMEATVEEILPTVELHVVADSVMSGSARFADYVLPVAHFFEQTDVVGRYLWNPYAMYQEKATEPLYECKSDFDIQKMLAKAMGVGESYWDMTDDEYLELWLDTDMARSIGITLDALKEKKSLKYISTDYVHGDYEKGEFPFVHLGL